MWDGFNKRKFPRVNVRCDISIQSNPQLKPLSTHTQNLGLGGVCVLVDHEFKRFQECELSLEIAEGEKRIKCKGKISWIVPTREVKERKNVYDTGIEFVDISPSDTKRIQDYLASSTGAK